MLELLLLLQLQHASLLAALCSGAKGICLKNLLLRFSLLSEGGFCLMTKQSTDEQTIQPKLKVRSKRNMPALEIIERNIVFLFAVFLGGLGIALVTSADIGTTPISSINYVISLHTPLTLGATTFIFNILLVIIQVFLVGRQYAREHALIMFLQIPVTLIFSSTIDVAMYTIDMLVPDELPYIGRLLLLALGSLTLAIGVTLQVCADVAMVAGEAFVKALSMRLHKEFGFIKTFFDSSLVLLAVVTSFVWTNFTAVEGVREGTIIGALSIGPMVRFFLPRVQPKFARFFVRHRAVKP